MFMEHMNISWLISAHPLPACQVELLSFRGEELTEDGGILRRIKVKGHGYNNPNDGATVHGIYFLFIFRNT